MFIIPAIYLSSGRCVSHYKGKSEQKTIHRLDPLSSARMFEKDGASILHVVDLDATDGSNPAHCEIAKKLARETSLSIQYAEGIDSQEAIEELFNAGIARISLNQFSENLLASLLRLYGQDKILFTIRSQRNIVDGKPGVEVMDYGKDIAAKGVKNIIFRDTKIEGTYHPNFDEIERLVLSAHANIFAFGGIGSIADLEILQKTGAAGVIISRAFFERRLSLRDCIKKFEEGMR